LTGNKNTENSSAHTAQKRFEESAMNFLDAQMQRIQQRETIMAEVRRRNAEMVFMKHQADA
jgi:hypothetical protein